MSKNPEGTIKFFDVLDERYRNHRATSVSLRNVTIVHQDALLLLLATLVRFKGNDIRFDGDFPKNNKAKKAFIRSGFFSLREQNIEDQDAYFFENAMKTHANKTVDSAMTAELTRKAAEVVWGKGYISQGVQSVFVELMQNTNNHASPLKQGERRWWISVTYDHKKQRARFVFVDFGIGVIRSLENKSPEHKWYDIRHKVYKVFQTDSPTHYLRLILDRDLHQTVTSKPFRGKGLPGIKSTLDRNWISNLSIVTNEVFAQVSESRYRLMNCSFQGTLVSWEISRDNLVTAPSS